MRIVSEVLLSTVGPLLVVLVLALIRGIFAVRDNTNAVKELTKDLAAWIDDSKSVHAALDARVRTLEDWRLTVESRGH